MGSAHKCLAHTEGYLAWRRRQRESERREFENSRLSVRHHTWRITFQTEFCSAELASFKEYLKAHKEYSLFFLENFLETFEWYLGNLEKIQPDVDALVRVFDLPGWREARGLAPDNEDRIIRERYGTPSNMKGVKRASTQGNPGRRKKNPTVKNNFLA